MTRPILQTSRLSLRDFRPSDAADVHLHLCDWDVVKMIARPPWPYTMADAATFVQTAKGRAIEFSSEVIGAIGIGESKKGASIGYWIGKAYWGRGLATEAARAVIQDYFEYPTSDRLFSAFVDDNGASWRVQEKLGFEKIGEGSVFVVSRGQDAKDIRTRLTRHAFEKAKS